MSRIIVWILGLVLAAGFTPVMARATFRMAKLAVNAQRFDQMSYGKFKKALWRKPQGSRPHLRD